MGFTLAVELWADWSWRNGREFLWIYNVFVVVEYGLLCWYFKNIPRGVLKKYIGWSVVLFAVVSVVVSVSLYGFSKFPGQNINLEGILISFICAAVLFNLDSRLYPTISRHPDFWICCGWLIFFAGTFFSNGLLYYLMSMHVDHAKKIFESLNRPLNLILYSCLIVGFVCAIPRK
jgi:hypothetical protein